MRATWLGFGLGFVLLGCTMDNPAFDVERGTGIADESGDGDSSSSKGSADAPGDGDPSGDGDPGETSTSEGSSDTTAGDCMCGPCQKCDDLGECVIDVGGPCDDATALHCSDYLYGVEGGLCYKLPEVTLYGRCSEQGVCEQSSPSDCPSEPGAVHFACDGACINNVQGCPAHAKVADVEMSDMCVVDGEGPDCKTICANGTGSAIKNYACSVGECVFLGNEQLCDAYACDVEGVFCYDSCETEAQCAQSFACISNTCVLP